MSAEPRPAYFIDTNILVYAFDRSAGQKHAIAAQLVRDCWEAETGCLNIQVLQEFIVNVTRKITAPLALKTTQEIVADLAQWRVHAPQVNDLLQALEYQERYQLSFWDAMVVQSAARLGCKRLLSEDLNHGQIYGELQVINPFKESK